LAKQNQAVCHDTLPWLISFSLDHAVNWEAIDSETVIGKLHRKIRMTEKIKSGRGLKMAGMLLLVTGLLGLEIQALPHSVLPQINHLILANVIFFPLTFVGAFLYWRGRQYAAKAVAERVISDSKPDVLYLRAFGTDPSCWATTNSTNFIDGWLTEEEQLCEVLQPIGDLVAIGKPGETLPTPGAARLYASDAEWKKVVTDQMQTARLVVIRAGTSGGLLWELKEVVQVVNPKKLLILIYHMRKKDYESFKTEAEQIFNTTFPKIEELTRFWTVSGFIRFSPNWSSNALPLRLPFFRFGLYKTSGRRFKYTLRPVFEEYGLEWKPPPVSIWWMVFIVLGFFFVVGVILAALLAFLGY
jgi:hypothetical protein